MEPGSGAICSPIESASATNATATDRLSIREKGVVTIPRTPVVTDPMSTGQYAQGYTPPNANVLHASKAIAVSVNREDGMSATLVGCLG
jgi:hypothetical protein